jgi:CheY-like chemotaxis protein
MKLISIESAPAPFTRKSRYILIVEGNNKELFYTAMLLQRFAYPVCTARTVHQALDMVSVAVPALVVADVVLPGNSGIDLMRMLGSNSRTLSIPMILLTPQGDSGPRNRDFGSQSAVCIPKPVPLEDLYRAVQEVMESNPRSNIRIQTALPVKVNNVPFNSAKGEAATHLSTQGMYIRTFKPFERNESVTVQLEIEDRTITADAKVLYSRRSDSMLVLEPGIAIKFTKMRGEDRQVITEFIHKELIRGMME